MATDLPSTMAAINALVATLKGYGVFK
jgi:hypothetical protein